MSKSVLAELLAAIDRAPPRDPKSFADSINNLCWRVCVFRDADDGCPLDGGDGELEAWTNGSECFWVCSMFDHCFDSTNKVVAKPLALRPATRSELRALSPRAATLLAFG